MKALSDNLLSLNFSDEGLVDTVDYLSIISSWSGLLERLEVLSQEVVLIGKSVSSNFLTMTD